MSSQHQDDRHRLLDHFFANSERKAYQVAYLAVKNRDDALDIVQDAMMKLAQKYAHRPENEWPPLFNRILHSRINDHYRRQYIKQRIFSWLPANKSGQEDVMDLIDDAPDITTPTPDQALINQTSTEAIQAALLTLPDRQRQCFLLRTWEGNDVKTTAKLMQCSEGSVKTHHSRALIKLRELLGEHHDSFARR